MVTDSMRISTLESYNNDNELDIDLEFDDDLNKIDDINIPENISHVWRMSKREAQYHFRLKEKEKEISLFTLEDVFLREHISKLDEEGAVYLYFMFHYVFKKKLELGQDYDYISILFNLEKLKNLARSDHIFLECFQYIKISERQHYPEQAKHLDMVFEPKEQCNTHDMQIFLNNAVEISPLEQDRCFLKKILEYCKDN